MAKTVSILIVSYNTCDLTLACIQSIYDQADDETFEIIVVDNVSADGSADEIEKRFPDLHLIRAQENLGFGRGNNLAAQQATGDYLLLLNPDTVVLDHAIDRLVRFARSSPESLLWGGRTVFADGSLNPTSCWRFMSPWSLFTQAIGLGRLFPNSNLLNREAYAGWNRDTVREVEMVTGCFLLITHDLWRTLDGFDDSFFMYAEETDLCFRAQKIGARPLFTPEASIVHYGGASEPVLAAKAIRLLSGKSHFILKNWPRYSRSLGIGLLKLHTGVRALGGGLLARLSRREEYVSTAENWKEVWAARHLWKQGYARPADNRA